ncbi:phage Gp37/Gp68 family protein [Cupriavidus taiwanensis]|uniref:phage Gp37/Gp68 family protein n=1 Tax=Cupriavidus taiwanensis TaxID=164546 RepID=UPI000E10E58A|nr:phage Gp37/Gp68 family protein [Cupriavidus taiwanensis]SOY56815.1 Bacteriophage protein gp37 [Cupriavidus taiwanensis]SOY90717.1 Bacteriophage protein gp37 [Cupriavidus taiwanensis]SOZ63522.1 Bacteriophage protein gp37 [Cupriavidus taiwanensis]SOZ82538.1 Bacteriophage protein gp37 [Cupriavidus taiwanensis]SOZ84407.1 Bacteriophage protein gp37 [Cupriavidus taiwanensis]
MSENSKIEWTDHTFNPWEGCQKVGPGCDHCYAETRNARFAGGTAVNWGGPGAPRRRTSAANWRKPLAWNAQHEKFFAEHGRRQRVFCASLADVFDNAVSVQWRYDLLRLIMATPNLDWLLLTKRIGNAGPMLEQAMRALTVGREGWRDNYLSNVWIGATIVNQAEADRDIPKLLTTPAAVRFLSMEPLLGPVDLRNVAVPAEHDQLRRPWDYEGYKFNALSSHDDDRFHQAPATIDWVIVGGESGPAARPMHPDWAIRLRDQCEGAGVPFLFKQWGEHAPNDRTMAEVEASQRGYTFVPYSEDQPYPIAAMDHVGKKAAGRLLDGVQHDGFPGAAA